MAKKKTSKKQKKSSKITFSEWKFDEKNGLYTTDNNGCDNCSY